VKKVSRDLDCIVGSVDLGFDSCDGGWRGDLSICILMSGEW
jgi:hypothetical protein